MSSAKVWASVWALRYSASSVEHVFRTALLSSFIVPLIKAQETVLLVTCSAAMAIEPPKATLRWGPFLFQLQFFRRARYPMNYNSNSGQTSLTDLGYYQVHASGDTTAAATSMPMPPRPSTESVPTWSSTTNWSSRHRLILSSRIRCRFLPKVSFLP